jgi:uncharacterized damage-inducible protein DinB
MVTLLDDAFAHHFWANEQVIDACAGLTPEQLATPVAGTYGPILGTLTHLVSTDGWYLGFFRDWTNLVEEDAGATLDDLRTANTTNTAAWMELLAGEPRADDDVPEQGEGWVFHAPVGIRLAQVVHHGTDHRSQVCTGLTSLGIEPPEIDVWAYGRAMGRSEMEDQRPGSNG